MPGRCWISPRQRRHGGVDKVVEDVFAALERQSVTVIGTDAVETIIGRVGASINNLGAERAQLAKEVERLLDDFPLRAVVISMPGVGAKTAATILQAIGDASAFPSATHLAAYAGIATRHSSIRQVGPRRAPRALGQQAAQERLVPFCLGWPALRS